MILLRLDEPGWLSKFYSLPFLVNRNFSSRRLFVPFSHTKSCQARPSYTCIKFDEINFHLCWPEDLSEQAFLKLQLQLSLQNVGKIATLNPTPSNEQMFRRWHLAGTTQCIHIFKSTKHKKRLNSIASSTYIPNRSWDRRDRAPSVGPTTRGSYYAGSRETSPVRTGSTSRSAHAHKCLHFVKGINAKWSWQQLRLVLRG